MPVSRTSEGTFLGRHPHPSGGFRQGTPDGSSDPQAPPGSQERGMPAASKGRRSYRADASCAVWLHAVSQLAPRAAPIRDESGRSWRAFVVAPRAAQDYRASNSSGTRCPGRLPSCVAAPATLGVNAGTRMAPGADPDQIVSLRSVPTPRAGGSSHLETRSGEDEVALRLAADLTGIEGEPWWWWPLLGLT